MWNSQIKSVKNVIIKKSVTKVFQVYISIVYDSFFLELSTSISISTALLLWRCVKYGLLSKYLLERKRQYGGCKYHTTITWNKKHLSKQATSITYTWRKTFLQLLLLKVCELFRFRQIKKVEVHCGL